MGVWMDAGRVATVTLSRRELEEAKL